MLPFPSPVTLNPSFPPPPPFTCSHRHLQSWSLPPTQVPSCPMDGAENQPRSDTRRGVAPALESAGSCWCWGHREAELRGGCRGWQDAGRERVLGPGPDMGRGPGEGRGDSRFADITEGVGADGARSPAAAATAHPRLPARLRPPETTAPRHRHLW